MARSLEHKVELIFLFGASNENYHETERRFNERFPDHPTSRTYIRQLVNKFRTTGSINDAKRTGRPSMTEEQQLNVLCEFIENPSHSKRSASQVCEVPPSSVLKTLKKNKIHPYKIQLYHAMNEDDHDRRLQFCEVIENVTRENPTFDHNICFSDESSFSINGLVNRHNCRYWDTENPKIVSEGKSQYRQKVNVWAGILGNHIIGPFFIDGNLNGRVYLDLLQNRIVPSFMLS